MVMCGEMQGFQQEAETNKKTVQRRSYDRQNKRRIHIVRNDDRHCDHRTTRGDSNSESREDQTREISTSHDAKSFACSMQRMSKSLYKRKHKFPRSGGGQGRPISNGSIVLRA